MSATVHPDPDRPGKLHAERGTRPIRSGSRADRDPGRAGAGRAGRR